MRLYSIIFLLIGSFFLKTAFACYYNNPCPDPKCEYRSAFLSALGPQELEANISYDALEEANKRGQNQGPFQIKWVEMDVREARSILSEEKLLEFLDQIKNEEVKRGKTITRFSLNRQYHVSPKVIEKLVSLFPHLKFLDLGSIPKLNLSSLSLLKSLEGLNLQSSNVTQEIISQVAQIKGLKVLNLNFNKMEGLSLEPLSALPELTYLDLSHDPISEEQLMELSLLRNLKALHLVGHYDSLKKSFHSIEHLSKVPLRTLNLSYTRLPDHAGTSIGKISTLETLILRSDGWDPFYNGLDGHNYGGGPYQASSKIEGIEALTKLTHFDAENAGLGNLSAAVLSKMPWIQRLNLSRNRLIPVILDHLTKITELKHLEARGAQPAELFPSVLAFSQLSELHISLKDEDLDHHPEWLEGLGRIAKLNVLQVSGYPDQYGSYLQTINLDPTRFNILTGALSSKTVELRGVQYYDVNTDIVNFFMFSPLARELGVNWQ